MDNPLVSIITATSNLVEAGRGDAIGRCVRSVANLPFAHEHLIQDGGSKDGTLDLLNALKLECPGLEIKSEADKGVYDAFNKAVRRARGKWIYFLGSDDYVFDPEAMAEVVRMAEMSQKRFVISLVRNSDGSNWFSGPKDFSNILIIKSYGHQGVLMTRDLIEELGGFDVNYRIASDFNLCLKAHLKNEKHLFIAKTFAQFAVGGGLSTSDSVERKERLNISAELLGVREKERSLLLSKQLLPWRIVLPLLGHRNRVVRQGARYAAMRKIANAIGLLDAQGGPNLHFCKTVIEKIHTYGLRGVFNYFWGRFSDKPLLIRFQINAFLHKATLAPGITVVGPIGGECSYSKCLRDLIVKLWKCKIPYQTYNTAKSSAGIDGDFRKLLTPECDFRALRYSSVWGWFPRSLLRNRKGISRFKIVFWEFETGVIENDSSLLVEPGLLTMSKFSAQSIRQEAKGRVAVKEVLYPFLMPSDDLLSRNDIRKRFELKEGEFLVFFNFSIASSYYRKNPEGAIRAFARAFSDIPDARLVFKVQGSKAHPDKVQRMIELARELGIGDRMTLITTFLSTKELYSLTAACDVYLSLHRGEGFGLGIAEAMSLGVPVVVTNYSAPTEFCTADNSMLVPIVMKDVPPQEVDLPCYRFVRQWAEPDILAAAAALRRLYDDRLFCVELGERAARSVSEQFSSEKFKESINRLM